MPVERVYADPKVKADVGRVALQRGPIVYCLEGVDNDGQVRNLVLPKDAKLTAYVRKGPAPRRRGRARRGAGGDRADDDGKLVTRSRKFQAVPYCDLGQPQAGADGRLAARDAGVGRIPRRTGRHSPTACGSAPRTSIPTTRWPRSTTADVRNRRTTTSIPRMTWWDHKGSDEWLSYRFAEPRQVSEAVRLLVRRHRHRPLPGAGGMAVAVEGRDEWKPVKLTGGSRYGTGLDQFNKVTFEPVRTSELKMEVRLQGDFSGGVLKWTTAGPK